ncbi:MAG: SPOR domain-containing protein [Treponema sp.]|nr:SPOR domain-containing protein [Treponema sp.]
MKRRIILFAVVTGIILFLTGSSPWEGAAAVAPSGELPETGFFVATNSFPRNTVVDITNIETGRTARAIVANSLYNSGLLAIVSREAAESIGMRAGSVSRIRMVQPSDPMAYQQFTERLASGIPMVNDPAAEQRMLSELYSTDTYVPPAVPAAPSYPSSPTSPVDLVNRGVERGYVIDEPEWGGNGRLNIVEVPGFLVEPLQPFVAPAEPYTVIAETVPPSEPAAVSPPVTAPPPAAVTPPVTAQVDPVVQPEETPVKDTVRYVDVFEPASKETIVTIMPRISVESIVQEKEIDKPVFTAEYTEASSEVVKDIPSRIEEASNMSIVKNVPEYIREINNRETEKAVPEFTAVNDSHDEFIKQTSEYITEQPRSETNKEILDWFDPVSPTLFSEKPEKYIEPASLAEEPFVIAEKLEKPVEPALTGEPFVIVEKLEEPAELTYLTEEPFVVAEKLEKPAEPAALTEEPSVIAEKLEEPEEPASLAEEPFVIAEKLEKPAEPAAITEEPSVIAQVPSEPIPPAPVKEEPPVVVAEAPVYVLPTQPFVPVESTPRVMEPTVYNIPLSDIIPGIASAPPAAGSQSVPVIPESYIIPSVTPAAPPQSSAPAPSVIPPSLIIAPPAVTPAAAVTSSPAAVTPAASSIQQSFSVRTISQLDRGQYYVQLASLPVNQVENVIRQIDYRYNPVVLRDGDNMYRILIGPLNQGESAAILQRFRSIGFNDAFVRYGN